MDNYTATLLLTLSVPGLAILTINSTKNHETFESKVGVYLVFYVTEEGWVRRGGKGEGGCGEIFLWNCLSEYHSLFPESVLIGKCDFLGCVYK